MKQVTIWVADDGTQFDTKEACDEYEKTHALFNFIEHNIGYTYNDDAGFSIIEESDVEKFILENLPELNVIIARQQELS